MSNDDNQDNNDEDSTNGLFRDSIGEIKRYHHNKVELKTEKPRPIPQKTIEDEQQVLTDLLSDAYSPNEPTATDQLHFMRPGIQHAVMRKLKRGHLSIEAELDLHGLTINIARQQISQFLTECLNLELRCVRIIHGKGIRSGDQGPKLKQNVNHWLPQRDEVLAFCSTIPSHGGTGAVYVLLKKKK